MLIFAECRPTNAPASSSALSSASRVSGLSGSIQTSSLLRRFPRAIDAACGVIGAEIGARPSSSYGRSRRLIDQRATWSTFAQRPDLSVLSASVQAVEHGHKLQAK